MPQSDRLDRFSSPIHQGYRAMAVGGVVLFHVAGLWALQSGLAQQVIEVVVPAHAIITELVTPTAPIAPPVPLVQPPTPRSPAPVPPKVPTPHPTPKTIQNTPIAPTPVVDTVEPTAPKPVAPSPPPVPEPPSAPMAPPMVPPAPPKIELPSSNAAYLQNPAPNYPAISKRMGEHGKVVLRVLISADGLPQKIELHQSSGYDRLDRQAQDAVARWRFIPGKRNGVAEAMWNIVPINFVLE